MWWLSSLIAVLLLPVIGNAGCEDEPWNCDFSQHFCEWTNNNWTKTNGNNNHARLNNNVLSGDIQSKMRRVTSNITHCMKFRFYLEKSNINTLTVSIKRSSENTEELLWAYSIKTDFTNASVPINSCSDFVLIFRGNRESKNNKKIRVDDFKYENSSCEILPLSAAPHQADTTNDPTTTTTTSTTLEKSTEETTYFSKTSTAVLVTYTAVNTSASGVITDADASSDKTGTIVGTVFAVITVALITIIIFLVLRRKQSPLLTVCFSKKKEDAQQSGFVDRAFHSARQNNTDPDNTNRAATYANCSNNSASMVNPDLSPNDYSVIRDIGTDDVTSSAFQPGTSLYCKAQVLQSTHKEDDDSKTEVSSTYANHYDVVGDELGKYPARVSSKVVEYDNLTAGRSHQTGKSSERTKSSYSKSEDSSYACNRAQLATPDDTVYQNTKECSLSQPSIMQEGDMNGSEVKKGGSTGEERAMESDYYNVDKTTATHLDPEATSTYHILDEDTQSDQEETQTGSVYHVLEPDPLVTEPSKRTIGIYHTLEDTETQSPNENTVASKKSSHSNTTLTRGGKGDYHSLDFQKMRGGDAAGDSGDEMDQTYSHLNEAGEDTYSELSREKKRKVVDGDYSHVTLD